MVFLDDLVAFFDQLLKLDVKIGEGPVEPVEHHLLERLRPGHLKRGVLLHLGVEDLLDRLDELFRVAGSSFLPQDASR